MRHLFARGRPGISSKRLSPTLWLIKRVHDDSMQEQFLNQLNEQYGERFAFLFVHGDFAQLVSALILDVVSFIRFAISGVVAY